MLKKKKEKIGKKVEKEIMPPKVTEPLPEVIKIEEKPIEEIKVVTKKGKCSRCGNDFKINSAVIKNRIEVCSVCFAPISWSA